MKSAIVFSSLNRLDSREVRSNIARIPEVCAVLTEAQGAWDTHQSSEFNFHNFLSSENHIFLQSIKLKSLVTAIVQVGLYRRFVKKFPLPQYLLGSFNDDSALKVCSGEICFEEMIMGSQALSIPKKVSPQNAFPTPLLSGIALIEYSIYYNKAEEGSDYVLYESKSHDIRHMIQNLVDSHGVKRLISIGPGQRMLDGDQQEFLFHGTQVLESIELDPMLSWFWPRVHQSDSCGQQVVAH